MAGTAEAPTRGRFSGAVDKLRLMDEMAWKYADDHEFNDVVMSEVAGADNSALSQVEAWSRRCHAIKYRRENGERYRHPLAVLAKGGDCDDQVIVFCAGARVLGLPCLVEILIDERGWGFHVRSRVGLPPVRPTQWPIVDTVWMSEAQWAMEAPAPATTRSPARRASTSPWSLAGTAGLDSPRSSTGQWLLSLLGIAAAVAIVKRTVRRRRS